MESLKRLWGRAGTSSLATSWTARSSGCVRSAGDCLSYTLGRNKAPTVSPESNDIPSPILAKCVMLEGAFLSTWRAPPSAPFDNLHSCSIKRRSRFLIRTCLICFPGCRRAQQHAEGSHAHCVGPPKENCKQPSAIGSSQGCASRCARVRGWPESMRSAVLQNIAAEEWPLH